MPPRNSIAILTLLLLITSSVVSAYTISPKDDIHEAVTRAAKVCFERSLSSGQKPSKCSPTLLNETKVDVSWIQDSKLAWYDLVGWTRRIVSADARYPTLEEAVRWPDDPTRQVGVSGAIKFGTNMLGDCNRYIGDHPLGINDINDGLLCNSHFGEMQFFHAQASQIGEPYDITQAKIEAWATFLFTVAGHMTDAELDKEYCSFFSKGDAFNRAMLPNQAAIPCEDEKDPKWTLTTLFTFKCPNPVSSKGCYEESGNSRFDKSRINATGALLHLIQDSFSQSHTERGACEVFDKKVKAKIECLPISRFTTYRGQENHSDADRYPVFAASCDASNGIDDPILASAKALWHIRNGSKVADFMKDFGAVFGHSDGHLKVSGAATLGACFSEPL